MTQIVLLAAVAAINALCLLLGVRVGQKCARGERVSVPDPARAVQRIRQSREERREQANLEAMLRNIDNYDGTGAGQAEVD